VHLWGHLAQVFSVDFYVEEEAAVEGVLLVVAPDELGDGGVGHGGVWELPPGLGSAYRWQACPPEEGIIVFRLSEEGVLLLEEEEDDPTPLKELIQGFRPHFLRLLRRADVQPLLDDEDLKPAGEEIPLSHGLPPHPSPRPRKEMVGQYGVAQGHPMPPGEGSNQVAAPYVPQALPGQIGVKVEDAHTPSHGCNTPTTKGSSPYKKASPSPPNSQTPVDPPPARRSPPKKRTEKKAATNPTAGTHAKNGSKGKSPELKSNLVQLAHTGQPNKETPARPLPPSRRKKTTTRRNILLKDLQKGDVPKITPQKALRDAVKRSFR